jgi:hypothetical protein
MTDGEIAYLALAIVTFISFLAVIGAASATEDKRRRE